MKITTILFDLDGTLLPMETEVFIKAYFGGLAKKVAPLGYAPDRLFDTIWRGTAAMVKNDGSVTNEQVFWRVFTESFGEQSLADMAAFDEFYAADFPKLGGSCGFDPAAAEVVRDLKRRGFRVVLATNPVFPRAATESRIRWAGLEPSEFDYITTYENSGTCKPNPAYYREIMQKLGLDPAECVMVGNDVEEDMVASTLGMGVFLLTNCLISRNATDISALPHGGFAELKTFLAAL